MLRAIIFGSFLAVLGACAHQEKAAPALSVADLARVAGSGWAGTLIYRDYSPPFEEVMLNVEADVATTPEGLEIALRYPAEPNANGTSRLDLSAGGTVLGGDPVISRSDDGGVAAATTRGPCEDDNKPATCEHLYRFGEREFIMEKRVRFEGEQEFRRRNVYRLAR
jgi:hypothetical protein